MAASSDWTSQDRAACHENASEAGTSWGSAGGLQGLELAPHLRHLADDVTQHRRRVVEVDVRILCVDLPLLAQLSRGLTEFTGKRAARSRLRVEPLDVEHPKMRVQIEPELRREKAERGDE